jgi:hypothetical protein
VADAIGRAKSGKVAKADIRAVVAGALAPLAKSTAVLRAEIAELREAADAGLPLATYRQQQGQLGNPERYERLALNRDGPGGQTATRPRRA